MSEINFLKPTADDLRAIYQVCILENPYIPYEPTPKQFEFIMDFSHEIFYGGAAGGGKSIALLMAALMFVDFPEYHALILRRTLSMLTQPEALIDISHQWLSKTDAKWSEREKKWTFPSGSTLRFGYMDNERDKDNYQGAAYQFVGFDELTQFKESMYLYLFSRQRKKRTSQIPIRTRCTANPGGEGHEWVKKRYVVEGKQFGRRFISAGLKDNPHLDAEEYVKALSNLDPVTKEQLLNGDWDVVEQGNLFKREKFHFVTSWPTEATNRVRWWDMAATEKNSKNLDPDYTVGVQMVEWEGEYWIVDVVRFRDTPKVNEEKIKETADLDGVETTIWQEQEPGSSGKAQSDHYAREVLKGFDFHSEQTTGNKVTRAKPFSAAFENGLVHIVRATWNGAFMKELLAFPNPRVHDDQVDAASGAFSKLAPTPKKGVDAYLQAMREAREARENKDYLQSLQDDVKNERDKDYYQDKILAQRKEREEAVKKIEEEIERRRNKRV